MKNRNVLKLALIGALVGIVVFDIVSIGLYLATGIKIGLENTGCLISCYIFSAAYIPLVIICLYYCKKVEILDMSLSKKILYTTLSGFAMTFIPAIGIGIIDLIFKSDEAIVLILLNLMGVILMMGTNEIVVVVMNKGNVKEINKKIKEKVLEDK